MADHDNCNFGIRSEQFERNPFSVQNFIFITNESGQENIHFLLSLKSIGKSDKWHK